MGILSGLMGNASVVSNEKLEKDYEKILTKNEKIEAGFKVIRDMFVFTNKRHISLKILIYDGMGFWLCIRRFSKGKLAWWPQNIEQAKNISAKELQIIFYQGNPLFYKLPKDFSPVTKPP